jgi:hypothetical protein
VVAATEVVEVTLPRSTRVERRGQLRGPAPVPHQVRQIMVQVEQVGPGVLRLSNPQAPGWSGMASNPQQLAAVVASAFTEAQCAAVAWWRGQQYEAPTGERYTRPIPRRPSARRDVHDPRAWRVTPDGMWRDPGRGKLWGPDTQVVRRVRARRITLGLPAEAPMEGTDQEATQ